MGLHIAIGFTGQEGSALPFPVYVGRSKSEMLAAMEGSNAVRFEVISNQTGVRKNNPRHDGSKDVRAGTAEQVLRELVAEELGNNAGLVEKLKVVQEEKEAALKQAADELVKLAQEKRDLEKELAEARKSHSKK